LPAEGGAARKVTQDGGGAAQESADGQSLYFLKPDHTIWRMPVEGGAAQQVLAPPGVLRSFTLGPQGMYYVMRTEKGGCDVRYFDFASKSSRSLYSSDLSPAWGVSLAPDGRTLLFSLNDPATGSDLMLIENFR
jgi:hypothetical protein